jgi:hypothetical protein
LRVESYFSQLRKLIANCAVAALWQYEEDVRTVALGSFKARIFFLDDSLLDFREFVDTSTRPVSRFSYSYHYQKNEQMIFRYDNAPHHPELAGFPHHKHVADSAIACRPPSLADVLTEIGKMVLHQ